MRHCMIDIEAFGNGLVVAIGAVQFDPHSNETGAEFYVNIDPGSVEKYGFKPDSDTMLWWFSQSETVRKHIQHPKPKPVKQALTEFIKWWQTVNLKWAWSHQYDARAFRDLFEKTHGGFMPWRGKDVCDYGTMTKLQTGFSFKTVEREGTHHNALDDAKHQVKVLQKIIAENKLRLSI